MAKPKMLFVDDRTKRMEYALQHYSADYDVKLAANFFEAMRLLSSTDFDLVDLDHDLDGCDFQDPDSNTCGMEIVRYIEKTGWPEKRKRPVFCVHSSNLFAAHLMVVSLQKLGFQCYYKKIVYDMENMKYDKDGNPI